MYLKFSFEIEGDRIYLTISQTVLGEEVYCIKKDVTDEAIKLVTKIKNNEKRGVIK